MTPKKHTGDVLPYLNIYYIFSRYILARLRGRFIFHLKEDLEFYDLVRTDFSGPTKIATCQDLISLFQVMYTFYPNKKEKVTKYAGIIYSPLVTEITTK
jgi:hypothetical protein